MSLKAIKHVDSVRVVGKDNQATAVVQMEMLNSPTNGQHDSESFATENAVVARNGSERVIETNVASGVPKT